MYEILGHTTATGKKLIHNKRPDNLQYNVIERNCGQCSGCRIQRRMDLAFRLKCESEFHDESWFVTLTYDDENLPPGHSLKHKEISAFMKALRQNAKRAGIKNKLRFFGVGEYGGETLRPHYHLIIFGLPLPDRQLLYRKYNQNHFSAQFLELMGTAQQGIPHYQAEILSKSWTKGFAQATPVSTATMNYVAKYHIDKVNGEKAETHYQRIMPDGAIVDVEPEIARMSTNPGLGRKWIEKYYSDVYPHGYVVNENGTKFAPPKYFDNWYEKHYPEQHAELKFQRFWKRELTLERDGEREAIHKNREASRQLFRKPSAL